MEAATTPGSSLGRRVSRCTTLFIVTFILMLAVGCGLLYTVGAFARFLSIFYVTGYGIMAIGYHAMALVFAGLNRRRVEKMKTSSGDIESSMCIENSRFPLTTLHVVGYREDPEYFKKCLKSTNDLTYTNLNAIIVVIDGNDEDDEEMAEIAMETWPNAIRINLTSIPSRGSYDASLSQVVQSSSRAVYVVSQPHMGKREVLYTAFKISQKLGAEYFMNTDSDTLLDPQCVSELVRMTDADQTIGAVAGELTIFNATNWLSVLASSRYFMAFNVERAAQSYHGAVGCISGPMGLYHMGSAATIIDAWADQTFMGVKCSFGDDRHLTNKILSLGKNVVYTHLATASTETPQSYCRFVAQQTRWAKSYWREMVLQLQWAHHSWYTVMEIVYGLVFPFLVLVTLVSVVFTRDWWSLAAIGIVTAVIPVIKTAVVFFLFKKDARLWTTVAYPILYFTTLLPVKIFALFTINDNRWGTSSRKRVVNTIAPVFPVAAWVLVLIAGLVRHGFFKNE